MFRWRLSSTYPTIWGLAALVNTHSQGEDIQAEKMYGLHHWILFRLIEAAQPVSISTCACLWAKWSRLPWEPGVKQYEWAKEKTICLRTVVCASLCTSGGQTSERGKFLVQFLIGEKQKKSISDRVSWKIGNRNRNKEKVSTGIRERTHTPSSPVAFLPGVFVNHPFRSVSLWVGPLPFDAGTFVARDSAAIQIVYRRLAPLCFSHRPHLIRGT